MSPPWTSSVPQSWPSVWWWDDPHDALGFFQGYHWMSQKKGGHNGEKPVEITGIDFVTSGPSRRFFEWSSNMLDMPWHSSVLSALYSDILSYMYYSYLVGGWATPLKNMKVNWMMIFPIYGKKKATKPPTRYILTHKVGHLIWYLTELSSVSDWSPPTKQPSVWHEFRHSCLTCLRNSIWHSIWHTF